MNRKVLTLSGSRFWTQRLLRQRLFLALFGFIVFMHGHPPAHGQPNELPSLGNASSEAISLDNEKRLGAAWLRSLLGQVDTFEHPIVENYLSELVYSLAPNSSVVDREFSFVILDSKALNAFAVPGSVIGVNAGLFIHALSEQEFASVMAHELAHIGQRHYARRLEKQKTATPLTFAGILASVVIAATAGSEAGVAALASTQAFAAENQLSFSRQNEEEADRIGIATMFESGYDPRAMPVMFERMYRQTRIQGVQLPEYLSTHPLSENRISDTRNRATQYPRRAYKDSIEYHISRAIIINHYADTTLAAQQYFDSLLKQGNTINQVGAQYGLAISHLDTAPERSEAILNELLARHPNQISIQLGLSKALFNQGKYEQSKSLLEKLLARNPNNYPILVYLAENQMAQENYSRAQALLTDLSRTHPSKTSVWYLLAEVSGKNKDIPEVHRARAEYFFLRNRLDQAAEQLELAIKKTEDGASIRSLLEKRLEEIAELKRNPIF